MFCCPTQHLRQRQMRNLAAALLLAHGVPMVVMGDEYGHSKVSGRQGGDYGHSKVRGRHGR